MNQKKTPTSGDVREQVDDYLQKKAHYDTYADALKRVLQQACSTSVPGAVVQSRAKDVSSVAEKWVRKYEKYRDGALKMTDLCGARVIVQTLEQVKAVCSFVETNFEVVEKDDKVLSLAESTFGYRDMHYLIRLKEGRSEGIGFTLKEIETIDKRIAELQVRTWVQHAWADTLHDRLYKAPLRLSGEVKRTGALLAAIMEDGDRAFDRLATELDGMAANYTAYASREEVEREIAVQELIHQNENDPKRKLLLALRLARLVAAGGDYGKVVDLLYPFRNIKGHLRSELLVELGHALCRKNQSSPTSNEYREGQGYLEDVLGIPGSKDLKQVPKLPEETSLVPNPRSYNSLQARALSRLSWSWGVVGEEFMARDGYRLAVEIEPGNPYYLANQLGFEICCCRNTGPVVDSMRTTIREAIKTCRSHALAGTELPYAYLTAGRLSLLLGETYSALGWYARGIRDLLTGMSYVPLQLLKNELEWLKLISCEPQKRDNVWVKALIRLALSLQERRTADSPKASLKGPAALIVSGGAVSISSADLENARPMLMAALKDFHGTVTSGGTTSGVPGCVGEIAYQLKKTGSKGFELVGYIPKLLPIDALKDERYDRLERIGEKDSFSPEQVLKYWEDLLAAGIEPRQVVLLGFGGGPISAFEYRIALALGATVAVLKGSGGEADRILSDPIWAGVSTLFPIPLDVASVRAFVTHAKEEYNADTFLKMATGFHERFVKGSTSRLPNNMKPWDKLEETYKKANFAQAEYAVEILRAAGMEVRPIDSGAISCVWFDEEEIQCMAILEHGRWNIERLNDGWRPGLKKDEDLKTHNCIVPWMDLPDDVKKYDIDAVIAIPEILAKANLEVYRLPDQKERLKSTQALLRIGGRQ